MCVRPARGRKGFASARARASTWAAEEPPRRPARGAGKEIIHLPLTEKFFVKVAYTQGKYFKCFSVLCE